MGHKVKQSLMSSRIDFFYYAFRNVLLVSVPILIISILILSLPRSSARRVLSSDNFIVSILSSCTLSSKVNEEHSVNVVDGTYNADIGRTTLTTFCNDRNGYVVYAVGDSNNEIGNNKLVSNINSNYDIVSNTNTTGNASSWAMKLSSLNNNIGDIDNPGYIINSNNNTVATNQGTDTPTIDPLYNDTYGTVPATWTKVAYKPSGTVNSTSGSSFSTTYAIYTSPTQPAGTYVGQVKYLLTHPSSAAPTDLYIMQNVAEWEDEISNEGDSVIATDIRDNKGYYVTRLADGHIWMTQNLDFDIDTTRTYTHNDTDLGWDTNSFDSNATWKPDTTNGKYNLPVNGTSVPGWSNQNNYPYSVDPGDVYYYTSNSTSDDIKYTSLSACITAGHTEGECKHYHVGNYYNWTAAIASNNSVDISTNEARASNSICPKGWRLPNTDTQDSIYNEFGRLFYSYNIINNKSNGTNSINYKAGGFDAVRVSPLWFLRSGLIGDGMLLNAPARGYYWSNMAVSQYNAYSLVFRTSGVWPADSYGKYTGRSVRCVAR